MLSADLTSRSCALGAVFVSLLLLGLIHPARYTPVLSEQYSSIRLQITAAAPEAADDPEEAADNQSSALKAAEPAPLSVLPAEAPTEPEADEAEAEESLDSAENDAPLQDPPESAASDDAGTSPAPELPPQAAEALTPPPAAADASAEARKQEADRAAELKAQQATAAEAARRKAAAAAAQAEQERQERAAREARERQAAEAAAAQRRAETEAAAARAAQEAKQQQARAFISQEIVALIKSRTVYPAQALRRKVQGTVLLEFDVKGGVITGCRVIQSSGSELLDNAALRLARTLEGFDSGQGGFDLKLQVPIRYALN